MRYNVFLWHIINIQLGYQTGNIILFVAFRMFTFQLKYQYFFCFFANIDFIIKIILKVFKALQNARNLTGYACRHSYLGFVG